MGSPGIIPDGAGLVRPVQIAGGLLTVPGRGGDLASSRDP